MSNFFDGGTVLMLFLLIVMVLIFSSGPLYLWWVNYKADRYIELKRELREHGRTKEIENAEREENTEDESVNRS